jgi:hypothetical protein
VVIETDNSNTAAVPLSGIAGSHTTLSYIVFITSLCAACSGPVRTSNPVAAPAAFAPPAGVVSAAVRHAAPPDAARRPVEREPGGADLDPTNDGVVAPPDPIADCDAMLERANVESVPSSLPVHREKNGRITCGAEQVVVYRAGPEAIRYNIPPVVTCGLALAIARLEVVVQEEATAHFGKRVARIDQGGTYTCRRMTRFRHMVSEHSYANAIDIRAFTLDDGRRIEVLAHFGGTDREPATPEAQFLRAVARRLYGQAVFSVVLTPFWDALHRDHFHLDMARYRVDGTK